MSTQSVDPLEAARARLRLFAEHVGVDPEALELAIFHGRQVLKAVPLPEIGSQGPALRSGVKPPEYAAADVLITHAISSDERGDYHPPRELAKRLADLLDQTHRQSPDRSVVIVCTPERHRAPGMGPAYAGTVIR